MASSLIQGHAEHRTRIRNNVQQPPVRAENPIRGCERRSCDVSDPAVMITDHVPAVRLPPDHEGDPVPLGSRIELVTCRLPCVKRLAAGGQWSDHDLVFSARTGGALDAANVRREFIAVCKAAGIGEHWTPRELRHSFVSLVSSSGVSLEEIARRA